MRKRFLTLLALLLALGIVFSPALARESVIPRALGRISSPRAGDALQGIVPIVGSTDVEDIRSWELSFGYANDSTNTWFILDRSNQAIRDQPLAQWDTTSITDGLYNLRLNIQLETGEQSDLIVANLRVRNYTPIETNTPHPSPTVLMTDTPTSIPPTLTPLPTSSIEISTNNFNNSLARGAILAAVFFLIMGLYASIRKTLR